MLVIIGYATVLLSVFGGFVMGGGYISALFQPVELLIITGAAVGSFLASNSRTTIKATLKMLPVLLKDIKYTKEIYMEVLALLYDLLVKIRKEGLMSIEEDVERPFESPFFFKFPNILKEQHLVEFISDYLRIMVSGNLNSLEIENLMDLEIETLHNEAMEPANVIGELAQAMPAFGIVAAVMGVVHTMESMSLPPAELGVLIAGALVGTFLGILLAYGFVGPMEKLLGQKAEETNKMLTIIKVTLLAHLNGYPPLMVVEFGRKALYLAERPGFLELEKYIKTKR